MKKIFQFSTLIAMCLTVIGLAGCAKDEFDTEQYSDDAVMFSAFAPNPVARGGALRILGSNLQRVSQVEIPGVEPITEIEVVSEGKYSEIRVIVPVEGPEIGPVTIVADGHRYSSKTDLEYSEPIVFDGFSPASAMPGDIITFKGDYMNNIRQVIFNDEVYVTEFEEQSRHELKVKVPAQAITGKVILGDVNENDNPEGLVSNLFYSETDLAIGDPTVKGAAIGTVKAGSTVAVTGSYLNMIASVYFGGVNAEFTVSEDAKTLTAIVPDTATDGAIAVVSYAGKEFPAGEYKTLEPSSLAIAADTRYKAGLGATITGKDLDLVTGASLAGTALDFVYDEDKITFTIPAAAADGTVVLSLANGKTVETEAIELVKPVITSVSPLEIYAGEENITVNGEDLDLVVSATLGGKAVELGEGASETSLELITSLTSVSGKVALSLENGVRVESSDEVTVNYHSLVIVTEMPAGQHIGMEVVLKGSNFDLVENIFIGDTKVTQYSLRTPEEVRFLMPWCKAGSYSMNFHLFNGDVETVATPIEVLLELDVKTIWEGNSNIGNWGGMSDLSWGGYDWSTVKVGTVLTAYFELDTASEYWQVRFGNGSWASIPSGVEIAGGEGNISMTEGATYYSITLTAADLDYLANQGGLVMTGCNYTLTKLTLSTEISQETELWTGSEDLGSEYGISWTINDGEDHSWWRSDAFTEGMSVRIYFTEYNSSDWGIQIFDGHWNHLYVDNSDSAIGPAFTNANSDASVGYIEFTATGAVFDLLKTQGWWGGQLILQGKNVIITKIAYI